MIIRMIHSIKALFLGKHSFKSMVGKVITGRYYVVKIIGQGGFGTTYLAEDTQRPGNPQCVVKQFTPANKQPQLLKKAAELFQREAETLGKLGNHSQIPTLLAHLEEDQEFFIVQEFIEGHDITEEIPFGTPLITDNVVKLLIEILEVLEYIHHQGVIHRDLKPSNIRRRTEDQKIVIIDFGAVKEIQKSHNPKNPTTISTDGYTPVEQRIGNPELSSDIYAVGIIAIQALTGKFATDIEIDGNTGKVIWRNHVTVSDQLADILDKMVESYYKDRYPSAKEALAALKQIPISPTPSHHNPPPSYHSQSKTAGITLPPPSHNSLPHPNHKHKLVKVAGVGAGLIMIGGIILFLIRPIPECGGKVSKYENTDHKLTIAYPQCWDSDYSTEPFTGKIATFVQPDRKAKLTITAKEFLGNLGNLEKSEEKDIKNHLQAGTVVDKNDRFVAKRKSRMIVATGEEGDQKIKNMYILILNGSTAYRIIYTAPESNYERFLPTVEQMIKSFQIDEK